LKMRHVQNKIPALPGIGAINGGAGGI